MPSKFHLKSFPDSFSCTADFNIVSPPDSPVLLYQSQTIQIFLARSLTNENFPRLCSQDPLLPYLFPRKFPSDSACHDISHLKSSHKFFFRRLRTSTIHVNFLVTFIVWLFVSVFFFWLYASFLESFSTCIFHGANLIRQICSPKVFVLFCRMLDQICSSKLLNQISSNNFRHANLRTYFFFCASLFALSNFPNPISFYMLLSPYHLFFLRIDFSRIASREIIHLILSQELQQCRLFYLPNPISQYELHVLRSQWPPHGLQWPHLLRWRSSPSNFAYTNLHIENEVVVAQIWLIKLAQSNIHRYSDPNNVASTNSHRWIVAFRSSVPRLRRATHPSFAQSLAGSTASPRKLKEKANNKIRYENWSCSLAVAGAIRPFTDVKMTSQLLTPTGIRIC